MDKRCTGRSVSKELVIALDGMGGDQGPSMVIQGAAIARKRFPNVHFKIFGDSTTIDPLLEKKTALKEITTVIHTDDVVTNETRPAVALRSGRQSSMRKAIDCVKEGEADCVVSAGNTGALMAMAKFVFKTLPGIDRPAIASFFPTLRGETVMMDLGANLQCDAQNLVQFAVMGEVFAREVLGIQKPSVGLLNVGSEDMKGHDDLREAALILRQDAVELNFHGFVEGDDIGAGSVDVVVTDGFTGNIALKTAEGTARLTSEFLRQSFQHSLMAKLGYIFARPALNKLRARMDPRKYNGAMFLGLNGICVKSHGGTDATGFSHAIAAAADMAQQDIIAEIKRDYQRVSAVLMASSDDIVRAK